MSNKKFTKGKANQETLADRMKKYEAVTTGTSLIERLPIYARIDMRAGHTFCRGLAKPFDNDYAGTMKAATAYVVEKTNALVGYCQSDEASFVWLDSSKIPFETRLFKLQSVLASMFTAAFIQNSRGIVVDKVSKIFPTFDCRVCNMPSLDEAANMILWRERDSIKNSITLLALEHFSDKEIERKKSNDKIKMLQDLKGIDYFKAIPKGLTYEDAPWRYYSKILMDFFLAEYGENWRQKMHKKDLVSELCSQNMFDRFRKFTDDYDLTDKHRAAWHRKINDVEYKYNHGLGFFMFTPKMSIDTCPAVMFRNIENTIHPYENRLINIRENMELMGMPHDFDLAVDDIHAGKIAYQLGQNVPLKTAEYMVSEAVRILLNWNVKDNNEVFSEENNYCMLDNIKQKRIA